MRRRRRDADQAQQAAATAWLHEMSTALDERLVVDARDIMPTDRPLLATRGSRRVRKAATARH